jgi:hypothetical protein
MVRTLRTGRFGAIAGAAVTALAAQQGAARLASAAHGFEFSPVSELPAPAEEGKSIDAFLGLSLGSDSNPGRATSGNEESDTVLEILAGAAFSRGNTHLDYRLSAEARRESYSDLDRFDSEEAVLQGDISWITRKARLALAGRFASLSDPVEVETLDFDLLEREDLSYAPEAGFTFGTIELGIGYPVRALDYEEGSLAYLDHEDSALEIELRLTRSKRAQYSLNVDSGAVDYEAFDPARPRHDFDYRRLYVGWRSTTAGESAIELGLGSYRVESGGFRGDDGLYFTGRMTRLFEGGESALEAAFTRGPEPAATADFKKASRLLLRCSKRANTRSRWSLGYALESSEFSNPDVTTAGSLTVHGADLGFERKLGSPEGRHGRLHAALAYESGDDFDRLRVSAGIALAY